MKKQNIFLKIWRILYPLGIHIGGQVIVIFVGIFAISFGIQYKLLSMDVSVSDSVLQTLFLQSYNRYALLLVGLGNLLVIPFLALFMHLDNLKYPVGKLTRKANPITYIFPIIVGLLFCVGCNQILTLMNYYNLLPQNTATLEMIYTQHLWEEVLFMGVIGPIGEELVMRGLIYKRLRGYSRVIPAMLISSIIFAIYHGNIPQGIYAFLLGCVFAYIYEKFQNILAPILVHVAANIFSILLTEFNLMSFLFESLNAVIISMTVCLVVGLFVLALVDLTVHTERAPYVAPVVPPMPMPPFHPAMYAGYPMGYGNPAMPMTAVSYASSVPGTQFPYPVGYMTPQGFVPFAIPQPMMMSESHATPTPESFTNPESQSAPTPAEFSEAVAADTAEAPVNPAMEQLLQEDFFSES